MLMLDDECTMCGMGTGAFCDFYFIIFFYPSNSHIKSEDKDLASSVGHTHIHTYTSLTHSRSLSLTPPPPYTSRLSRERQIAKLREYETSA